MNQTERIIAHDTSAAIAFLKAYTRGWQMTWWLQLVAIPPAQYEGHKPPTHPIEIRPDDIDSLAAWIDKYQGRENIYFCTNPLKHQLDKKAQKVDVAALACLHVDIDPRDGEPLEAERTRILKAVQDFSIKPSAVVNSGNGFGVFWRLAEPIPVNGEDFAALEDWNRRLSAHFGGDHCHNVDRIMRVPATVNIPGWKKLGKGCVTVVASLVEQNDAVYVPGDFEFLPPVAASARGKKAKVGDLGNEPVPERFQLALHTDSRLNARWHGNKEGLTDRSGSGLDMAVCSLLTASACLFTDPEIAAILRSYQFGKGAEASDAYLRLTISTARGSNYIESVAMPDDIPQPVTADSSGDKELTWLMENAPPVLKTYCEWYQASALRPHPLFALVSGLIFTQAVLGGSVALPRGLRPNLWMLLLAPTESGKGDVIRLAERAVGELPVFGVVDKGTGELGGLGPKAVRSFDHAVGSAEGLWWHLAKVNQVIWADEELAKMLTEVMAAPAGTPRHALRRTLLELHDAAPKSEISPIRYSQRAKTVNEMQPLHNPFLSLVGTGVPREIAKFNAAAADDGLLNRFLVVSVENIPDIGELKEVAPLPQAIKEWARKLGILEDLKGVLANPAQSPHTRDGAKVVQVYPGLDADWKAEMKFGAEKAQALPGVWGRLAEKVLKVALLCALLDSGQVTAKNFAWARRLVRWSAAGFEQRLGIEGGGSENEGDALAKAFMAVFDVPSLKGKPAVPSSAFANYSRVWRSCKDSQRRRRVIETLIQDGQIEEVLLEGKGGGLGYRLVEN